MLPRIALWSTLTAGMAWAQVQLQFPYGPQGATYNSIIPSVNGEPLLVGEQPGMSPFYTPRPAIALAAIGTTPFQNGLPPDLLPVLGGSGDDQPAAAALDPQGNVWIVGSTNSDDFNLVNPIMSEKVPYRTAGFVIELNSAGTSLLFATYLCGHQTGSPFFSSAASQIVFDGLGNAYVAGATTEPDFPVTPGAFQSPGAPGADGFGDVDSYAFIIKISPAGKLVYSTLLGSDEGHCCCGSSCIGNDSAYATVEGLAVDASGSVTLSGVTNSPSFPVTASTLQVQAPQGSGCGSSSAGGFVSRLSADASQLVWSTAVTASSDTISSLGMAEDSQGNVDLFGQYASCTEDLPAPYPTVTPGLFAAKLSSDGSQLLYSTDFGQSNDAAARGIALDAAGNEYLTGTSSSAQFPSLPGVANTGADFVLQLDPSGAQAQALIRLPTGTVSGAPVFDRSQNLLLIAAQTAMLQLPAGPAVSGPALAGFSNAASFALESGLWPGALVSLFGFGFPSSGQIPALDASGKFPTTVEGVQVLVDGVAAPLLYVGPNQINLQVPFETSVYSPIPLQLILPSGTVTANVPVSSALGLFTSGGAWAAALNQDGTVNSASNPAPPGSIVSLFGTGAIWPSGLADGALASGAAPLSQETNAFQVVDSGGVEASIFYAGAAPGLIDGVFQLNVQLPIGELSTNPTLTLKGAGGTSNAVQIYSQ